MVKWLKSPNSPNIVDVVLKDVDLVTIVEILVPRIAVTDLSRTPIEARFNVPSKDDYRVLEKKDNGTYFVVDLG